MNLLPKIQVLSDVVVVGGGGAGLAAAVTAARQGCKVVLTDILSKKRHFYG